MKTTKFTEEQITFALKGKGCGSGGLVLGMPIYILWEDKCEPLCLGKVGKGIREGGKRVDSKIQLPVFFCRKNLLRAILRYTRFFIFSSRLVCFAARFSFKDFVGSFLILTCFVFFSFAMALTFFWGVNS